MTKIQRPAQRRTAAQRASDANRVNQMSANVREGRPTPPPREAEAGRAAYEARHGGRSHQR